MQLNNNRHTGDSMDDPSNNRLQNPLRVVPGTTNRAIEMLSDLMQHFMECGAATQRPHESRWSGPQLVKIRK
jgi:hypothetical protein